MTNIMDRTTLARFLAGMALFVGVVFLASTHANAAADLYVAGAIKDAGKTSQPAPVFGPVVNGEYSVTYRGAFAVMEEDPKIAGVLAQDDPNPLRKGKKVWVIPFAQWPDSLKGAKVELCALQADWGCGSGNLAEIMPAGAKSWATGSVTDEGVTFPKVRVNPGAIEQKAKASLEGYTMVLIPASGLRAWVGYHPSYTLQTAKGTNAHVWKVDLVNNRVGPPTGLQKAFAGVVKQ